jgi:hypothetical protein
MHLNGWHRLWLLASGVWAVAILALAGAFQFDGDDALPTARMVLFLLRLWLVPVAAVYASGRGVAWVRRGFTPTHEGPLPTR